ncbi:hypothetical protein EJ02DRAFT_474319 [Clathrospora elynae]|uniref:Uncharacterized protein n=1 Tax=Clathrospora elynae TaxID=706981 RepID=A0A6A5SEY5_9PLEO|nr:hypothetical protein EJ02DRAFT_474319 [Clathrospora elynae]
MDMGAEMYMRLWRDRASRTKNAALMRNRYSLRRSNPSLAADSCWEGQSDTNSFSDTYLDPDTEADTDIDIELSTGEDAGFTLQQEPDADLDSEAEEILKDIAQLRAEGPAKPNHTPCQKCLCLPVDLSWSNSTLLTQTRQQDDDIYGIMSSHPAACLAAAKAFGHGLSAAHLDFIRQQNTNGAVSSVYTRFFVDHTEPLDALTWAREGMEWPLGDLLDGYEFLFLLQVRRRGRSSSRSASRSESVF